LVKLKIKRDVGTGMNMLLKKLERIGRDPEINAKSVGLPLCGAHEKLAEDGYFKSVDCQTYEV